MNQSDDRYFSSGQPRMENDFTRWMPLLIGGVLVAYGLSRRTKLGAATAAAGGAIAFKGVRSANQPSPHFFARSSILIGASPNEIYTYWRQFENLPRFMRHLESVTNSGNQSTWTAIGPAGKRIHWTAEIVSDQPGKHIAWRSLPGSDIEVDGTVEFREAPGGRGSFVDVTIQYRTPAGAAGNIVAKLFGKDPRFMMHQDMKRLKALLEAGEIPTTDGQSHGPRTMTAAAARILDPDNPIQGDSTLSEVADARRRVS